MKVHVPTCNILIIGFEVNEDMMRFIGQSGGFHFWTCSPLDLMVKEEVMWWAQGVKHSGGHRRFEENSKTKETQLIVSELKHF
jgi:hypothetical protein